MTPERRGRVIERNEDGMWVVEDPDGGAHSLNDTAHAIWELCDGMTTTREMAGAIVELTGMDPGKATGDVEMTIARLIELGLVEG